MSQELKAIRTIEDRIISGGHISQKEALLISGTKGTQVFDLFASANRIRNHFQGNKIDVCAIVNAKSGRCPEDCSYCAQSVKSSAEIVPYQLLCKEDVIKKAKDAKSGGSRRFCIVTSGKRVSEKEVAVISGMVREVKKIGLLPCATLGLLNENDLRELKKAGLVRYHNNLETSERFFPNICSTHSYREKIETIIAAQRSGLSVCSGGIFGMGETWQDRIDMAFLLREIGPDSVPINFLTPVKGTKLGKRKPLEPIEALKIISIYRFILPDKQIRVCGGRMQTLGEFHPFIFLAGASGLLSGNYLTTLGRGFSEDMQLIRQSGLTVG